MRHAKKGHRVISMDILEHLQKLYPALTKKQKTIADYLIANPEEISYITLALQHWFLQEVILWKDQTL